MVAIVTPRLVLRTLVPSDAAPLHALLTDAAFLAQIGDRGVASVADAAAAIRDRFPAHHAQHAYGMWAVTGAGGAFLGIAGLVRRPGLDAPDLGYALLPGARGQGYAREAGRGVLDWAAARGIARVLAVVKAGNMASAGVLTALDMREAGPVALPGMSEGMRLFVGGRRTRP